MTNLAEASWDTEGACELKQAAILLPGFRSACESLMPYAKLYYHATWSTKQREPLIDADRASLITRSVRDSCERMGVHCHAVGMVADHNHVAVSIPPKLAVADVIARLKGSSSHLVRNQSDGKPAFQWQAEYGVLTLTERALPRVVLYINNQAEHHGNGSTIAGLERFE